MWIYKSDTIPGLYNEFRADQPEMHSETLFQQNKKIKSKQPPNSWPLSSNRSLLINLLSMYCVFSHMPS